MDEFLCIVKVFAGNFAPRGWAFCDGQILSIAQNTAVFALLGTTYGGNGQYTFALPDLRVKDENGNATGYYKGFEGIEGGMKYIICLEGIFPSRN